LLQKIDIPQCCELLNKYLLQFKIHPHFNENDFIHWFTPRDRIIYSYVVEDPVTKLITDLFSFYFLPNQVLNNSKYQTVESAYMWYMVSTKTDKKQLINDALIIACEQKFDVFNCLNHQHNSEFLSYLKFREGSGNLKYYLYNWSTTPIQTNEVGLILV